MNVMVWDAKARSERAAHGRLRAAAPAGRRSTRQSDVLSLHIRGRPRRAHRDRGGPRADEADRAHRQHERAGLIAPGILEAALKQAGRAWPAIDVFEDEPVLEREPPAHPHDNVVATPHLGYVERSGYEDSSARPSTKSSRFSRQADQRDQSGRR
jgi:D-3-phosphoglycerate dehydrogenase